MKDETSKNEIMEIKPKKNEIVKISCQWVDLEKIRLSDITQSQKHFSLTCG